MRRKAAPKRELLPDPKFNSEMVAKFVNCIMCDGKKSIAEKIMYEALGSAKDKLKDVDIDATSGEPVEVGLLGLVIDKVKPNLEVKSRRVGGATYQVPVEVKAGRGFALAARWILDSAKKRGEKTMAQRLAGEMVDVCHNRGAALKKREDTHRMAQANKAFAHYRW